MSRAEAAYGLSGAQCVIAGHIVSGRSLKQIAHVLGRHRRTVEDHVAKLKRKTGSRTMVELVARLGAAGPNGQAREDAERLVREFVEAPRPDRSTGDRVHASRGRQHDP